MNEKMRQTIEYWEKECNKFTGDKSKFWSGKMSQLITSMEKCYIKDLSTWFDMLVEVKTRYDEEILKQPFMK